MFRFCLISLVIIASVIKNTSNQQRSEPLEDLKSFFQDYSTWERHKRESGDESNSTLNLNWGYRQEEITYWASNEKVDFYTAFIRCKQLGMDPVTVMTQEQNARLEKFYDPLIKPDDVYTGFWMSARKIGDQFYWLNTGRPLSFNKWYPNYPDNVGGNEICVSMLFSGSQGIGWNDLNYDNDRAFWMSAQKIGDKFIWLNTGQPLAFSKWFFNYPDNWRGNEDCLSMLYSTTAGIGWNDIECNKPLKFVCQKQLSSVAFVLDVNKSLN